jgi:uncharacterized membrane protein YeaQ/YmgE (transglycosylase-associated protein family)
MNVETIAITALTGLLAGWLTGLVMKDGGYGTAGDFGLGVVGGVLGGFALRMQGLAVDSRFALVAAAFGAFVLVVVQRKFWNRAIATTT